MESVMNKIEIGAADKLPYIRVGTAVPTAGGRTACTVPTGQSKNYGTEGSVGVSTQKIIAATRGEDAYSATTDYSKKTPIGCIGPNVFFSDLVIPTGTGGAQLANMIYSFCDPTGMKGVAKSEYNLNQNLFLYANAAGTASTVAPGTNTYFQQVQGIATGTATAKPTAAVTKAQCGVIQHVWDPIMAAQLTQGAFCCNAEYYGPDGLGRAQPYYQSGNTGAVANQGIALPTGVVAPTGTGLLSAFNPPLVGGDMSAESSPGDMCPAHGSGNGYTAKTYSAIYAQTSPPMKELLEGQAFYAALAPSQYSLPTTSTTAATQTARAKKQKKCAEHITSMMKLNKKAESLGAMVTNPADNTATEATATGSGTSSAAETVFDYSYSSIDFPLWKVALGAGSPAAKYTVPNGYCYANACFDDFAKVGTQSTFKGTEKLGELVKGPNMASIDADGAAVPVGHSVHCRIRVTDGNLPKRELYCGVGVTEDSGGACVTSRCACVYLGKFHHGSNVFRALLLLRGTSCLSFFSRAGGRNAVLRRGKSCVEGLAFQKLRHCRVVQTNVGNRISILSVILAVGRAHDARRDLSRHVSTRKRWLKGSK